MIPYIIRRLPINRGGVSRHLSTVTKFPAAPVSSITRVQYRSNTAAASSSGSAESKHDDKEERDKRDAANGATPNINDILRTLNPATVIKLVESIGQETITKMNLKSPLENLNANLTSVGSEGANQAVAALTLYLKLNRGHLLTDDEIDKHLSGLVPAKVIEFIKEKKNELPPDPVLTKLDELTEKMTKLEETLQKLQAAQNTSTPKVAAPGGKP